MALIHVPRPPKRRYNPDRPAGSLLMSQVVHLRDAESKLPLRYRSEIYVHAIRTEGEAARYIREVTEAIHEAHDDAARAANATRSEAQSDLRSRPRPRKHATENTQAKARRPARRSARSSNIQGGVYAVGHCSTGIVFYRRQRWLRKVCACRVAPRGRTCVRCLHSFKLHEPGVRVHTVYRSSAAHRGGQHASAERIRFGRGVRCSAKYRELADELGRRCGRRFQRIVARRRIHEEWSTRRVEQIHVSHTEEAGAKIGKARSNRCACIHTRSSIFTRKRFR